MTSDPILKKAKKNAEKGTKRRTEKSLKTSAGTTLKGQATRNRLVTEAIYVFSKQGYNNGSLQEIAKRCGLTQPALFHYFSGKKELIVAALERLIIDSFTVIDALIKPEDSARKRLENHFYGNLKWGFEYPEQAQLMILVYYLASFDKDFTKLYRPLLLRGRERVAVYLYAAQREHLLKKDEDVPALALYIYDHLVGSLLTTFTSDLAATSEETQIKSLKKRWKRLLDQFFVEE